MAELAPARIPRDSSGCQHDTPMYVTYFSQIPLILATRFTQKSRSPTLQCPESTKISIEYSKTTGLQNTRSKPISNSYSTGPQPHLRSARACKSPTLESTER